MNRWAGRRATDQTSGTRIVIVIDSLAALWQTMFVSIIPSLTTAAPGP
jgi:hypothetical protein